MSNTVHNTDAADFTVYELSDKRFTHYEIWAHRDIYFKTEGIAFLAVQKYNEMTGKETHIYKGKGKIELNHSMPKEQLDELAAYLLSLGFTGKHLKRGEGLR